METSVHLPPDQLSRIFLDQNKRVDCPVCGFNLHGTNGQRCPGCGATLVLQLAPPRTPASRMTWLTNCVSVLGLVTAAYGSYQFMSGAFYLLITAARWCPDLLYLSSGASALITGILLLTIARPIGRLIFH